MRWTATLGLVSLIGCHGGAKPGSAAPPVVTSAGPAVVGAKEAPNPAGPGSPAPPTPGSSASSPTDARPPCVVRGFPKNACDSAINAGGAQVGSGCGSPHSAFRGFARRVGRCLDEAPTRVGIQIVEMRFDDHGQAASVGTPGDVFGEPASSCLRDVLMNMVVWPAPEHAFFRATIECASSD